MRVDPIKENVSRQIARIGILCAMLVVFIHSYQFLELNGKDSFFAVLMEELISQNIALVAVPYFFLVSGFFLYRDFEFTADWFVRKVKSRIVSLVIPYVLWGLIGMVFTLFCSLVAQKLHEAPIDFSSMRWWLKVLGVTQKPLYVGQLWFVRMILEWLCLAPLVGWLVRRFGFCVPVFCLVIQCIPALANPWVHALLFISTGANIAFASRQTCDKMNLVLARRDVAIGIIMVWVALMAVRIWMSLTYGGAPHLWECSLFGMPIAYALIMKSIGIAAVWIIFGKLGDSRIWRRLDVVLGASFFIYCSHNMLLALFRSPLRRLPFIWEVDFLRYALPPVLSIMSGILGWYALGKGVPKVRKILCGGR